MAETTIPPKVERGCVHIQAVSLNPVFVCSLCSGYFREPVKINECMHTFCKSCLYKHMVQSATCPDCEISLKPHPIALIKPDRTLEALFEHCFPEVLAAERAKELAFYESIGEPPPANLVGASPMPSRAMDSTPGEGESASGTNGTASEGARERPTSLLKKQGKRKKAKQGGGDKVKFRLMPHQDACERCKPLESPFIVVSAKATVRHLKKFLSLKLGFSAEDGARLELTHQNAVVGPEYTLEYIVRLEHIGADSRPTFCYRLRPIE